MFSVLTAYLGALCAMIALAVVAIVALRTFFARSPKLHRGLFVFHDGAKVRYVDPIAAYLALEQDQEFRFDLHLRRAENGESEAIGIVANAVRTAFGVPVFTRPGQPGLTTAECHRLLGAFVLYIDAQKKSTSRLSIAQPSTEPTSSESSETTTNASSHSGSDVVALA